MNAAPVDPADLQQALDGRFPYNLLSASLQQRLSQQEYYAYTVKYCILRWFPYHRLPDFVKATISEASYYETMVQYGGEQLQLYPYALQKQVLFYTRETPLSYYVRMVAELLKAERSYDRLPNFTANDVLNLLGIGRNQYLNITKEVRSKLRWHVNRSYVPEHLPGELLPTVTLDPFWSLVPVVEPPSQQAQQMERVNKLCRSHPEDAALFRLLVTKGSDGVPGLSPTLSKGSFSFTTPFAKASVTDPQLLDALELDPQVFASDVVYACQAPYESVHRLYRKALICADFTVNPEDLVVIPPLGNFVMNRTSEEPMELLLYRVLSTLDDRTPLQLLAQLLMVPEEEVCAAVHALIRLGLARRKAVQVPTAIAQCPAAVHVSWQSIVAPLLALEAESQGSLGQGASPAERRMGSEPRRTGAADMDTSLPSVDAATSGCPALHPTTRAAQEGTDGIAGVGSHFPPAKAKGDGGQQQRQQLPPQKRIALLYDATLTGFLMMTNLSRDPVFKQHAVTLFEVGKMPNELVGSFLELLEKIDPGESTGFGGEAQRYITSAVTLRELLKVLRTVCAPDSDVPSGVDMLKIEALNELEATTRYSVLGRNYWAYVTTAPIATAPLIDVELSCVYGNTASLMASPWLLLFLYEKLKEGPPTVMLPFGSQLHSWPPEFHDLQDPPSPPAGRRDGGDDGGSPTVEGYAAKVRVQTITLDAEVSFVEMDTSLLLVNEMAVTAPVIMQCVAPLPLVSMPSRGQRDGGGAVAVQRGYHFLEVTLPFTAHPDDVQQLLYHRAAEKILPTLSTIPDDDDAGEEMDTAADPTDGVLFEDGGALVYKVLERCVDALHLRDSLGYITCCVSYHHAAAAITLEEGKGERHNATAAPLTSGTREERTSAASLVATKGTHMQRRVTLAIDRVDVVNIGLGIPLTHRECCSCILKSLPHLLSVEASERHNAAMRGCVEEFSLFLERYSTLTRETYGKLALRSTRVTGPMTQQHLRKVGGGGVVPYPAVTIVFTGRELHVVDDTNPVSEQWSV